jgi:hypothetical protein
MPASSSTRPVNAASVLACAFICSSMAAISFFTWVSSVMMSRFIMLRDTSPTSDLSLLASTVFG